ncbi:MAG: Ig-like domain-containing protein [bacterium]|nr:Ig-like domain-containing protein [bacterium]
MKKIITVILLLAATAGMALAQQLEVSPNPAEIMSNGVVQFSVSGQEQAAVIWQALPPSLGAISADGRFTAGNSAGQGIVRAMIQQGDKKLLGHALIRIAGGKVKGLAVKVSPGSARLEPGAAEQFSVEVSYLNGDPATAVISWQVVPAGLGTIDQNGTFTALTPGTGRIVALAKSDKFKGIGQAKIIVGSKLTPQKLLVEMTPVKASLKPGDNAVFSVTVNDRDGNPVTATLEYLVQPSGLGTIDGSGNFTAGKKPGVGMVKVMVKSENGAGTAKSLVVVEEKAQRYTVKIKPRQSALEPGQSLEFTAEAFDNSGNPVTPPYWAWKVIPEKLGEISPQGIFTAGQKSGQGKVVASLPSQFGQGQAAASIRIKRGQPLRVKVDPLRAILIPGQSQQFTAAVFSSEGKPIPETKVVWKVSPDGIGHINQSGLFIASGQPDSPKKGMIIAQVPLGQGGGQGGATVSISEYKIRIAESGTVTVSSGGSHSFSATVTDAMDRTVTSAELKWLTDPTSQQFGTISQTGEFTAGHTASQINGWVIVRATVNGSVIADRIAVEVKNN